MTMEAIKDRVYKHRIRIQDFFADYDKLRRGCISQSQFAAALSVAGFNFNARSYAALASAYPSSDAVFSVAYKAFCDDVNAVFTKKLLERTPLEDVDKEPSELLDPLRFSVRRGGSFPAGDDAEDSPGAGDDEIDERLAAALERVTDLAKTHRIYVKQFFDDAAKNQNSPMRVNHVTLTQFKRAMLTHVARDLSEADVEVIARAFTDEGMVNYAAFAATVDPKEPLFHPYSLSARAAQAAAAAVAAGA